MNIFFSHTTALQLSKEWHWGLEFEFELEFGIQSDLGRVEAMSEVSQFRGVDVVAVSLLPAVCPFPGSLCPLCYSHCLHWHCPQKCKTWVCTKLGPEHPLLAREASLSCLHTAVPGAQQHLLSPQGLTQQHSVSSCTDIPNTESTQVSTVSF